MKNAYRIPSAALRGHVVNSTLQGKNLNAYEANITGPTTGGPGLGFGL